MIQIKNKVDCCGCTACANICPKQAITMKPDPEGFLYPVVNEENCINCGVCDATCPIHNKIDRTKEKTKGFILRVKDEKKLFESTSGGGFTALAEYVLKNGGVVYGAGYDDSMRVICKKATSNDELKEMRGSKFVQSLLGNTYKDVKDELNTGKRVMYSGTPCQVEGLLCYLKKKPDNLLCVDFVCRGVPSPGLWENYVQFMERKFGSKMVGARFKHKTYGYHTTTMKIDFANGKTYYGSGRVDPYMKAFVSELASRPSCVTCKFKGLERPSDITIFDCYEYSQITGKKDDDKGYSSVFVHSDKGEKILQAIISGFDAIQEVNTEKLIECNGIMVRNSAKAHEKRDEFYKLAAALSIDKAINCVAPITYRDFAIERAKSFLYNTGTIKYIRKLKKKHTIATTK